LNARNNGERVENLALVDRIAAGLEIENARLGANSKLSWVGEQNLSDWYIDVRDSSIGFFGELKSRQRLNFYYLARATSAGVFTVPPAQIEDMYAPEKLNVSDMNKMTIGD
jgi:hypothetical protein